jgi:hypothetical protein
MKKIKLNFYVSTNIVGSQKEEIIEIEVDENLTKQEVNDIIEEEYKEWMYNNLDTCWTILD